jgi:hypothetical protein
LGFRLLLSSAALSCFNRSLRGLVLIQHVLSSRFPWTRYQNQLKLLMPIEDQWIPPEATWIPPEETIEAHKQWVPLVSLATDVDNLVRSGWWLQVLFFKFSVHVQLMYCSCNIFSRKEPLFFPFVSSSSWACLSHFLLYFWGGVGWGGVVLLCEFSDISQLLVKFWIMILYYYWK